MSDEGASKVDLVRRVREEFRELTGCDPEWISGLARVDGGWEIDVDVVEVRRIPETASLCAVYRVRTDDVGEVIGYERVRRFNRGQTG